MDANLCNATSVLHEPCGSGSDEHEELQHEALSRAATVEDSESHENQLPKPVKPNINGLVARKKGLKCFDVENYAFKVHNLIYLFHLLSLLCGFAVDVFPTKNEHVHLIVNILTTGFQE